MLRRYRSRIFAKKMRTDLDAMELSMANSLFRQNRENCEVDVRQDRRSQMIYPETLSDYSELTLVQTRLNLDVTIRRVQIPNCVDSHGAP